MAKRRSCGRIARPWLVGTGAVAALGAGCLAYGSLLERNWFTVRREQLAVLPRGAATVRVLHLADIHLDVGQRKKRAWLQTLAELDPDLVVNTGDNLTHPEAINPLLDALRPLLHSPGVFVPGSNDYYAPILKNPLSYLRGPSTHKRRGKNGQLLDKQPKKLDTAALHGGFGRAGWINLSNRAQSLVINGIRFDFSGMDDPHLQRDRYAGWPAGSSSSQHAPHIRVGVVHAPYQRALDQLTSGGADLILAGHTHGGQVCIPGYGAVVSNCDLPARLARGLTEWTAGGYTSALNVSAGIGTSRTAPVRFACRPEAVLIELTARG